MNSQTTTPPTPSQLLGFVVIGRNEGERLQAGLTAIQALAPNAAVIYVDSGSSDGSVAFAQSLGMNTLELDLSIPFTAARARNAGFQKLLSEHPTLEVVQFMDGDCELLPGWLEAADAALQSESKIAIVSGRRIEKYPQASIYNALMDIEWNTPVGETLAVLGDMCVKVPVFTLVGGFNEQIIAAEDDDLCLRVHEAGYKILRLDADMSRHDANIMKLEQWYRRSKRGGHGYANIHHLHGHKNGGYFRRQLLSVVIWGGCVPSLFVLSLFSAPRAALVLLCLYLAFMFKTSLRRVKMGDKLPTAAAYGALIFTGKLPELLGALQFWKNRLLSRKHQLIEYK